MTTKPIPALSLWRPWPWLILHSGKDVENRSWPTSYRGLVVLHAGRMIDKHPLVELIGLDLTNEPNEPDALDLGFVGVAELVDVHTATDCRNISCGLCSPWATEDGWHWQLANPRHFPDPIPGPGRQRLFTPPSDVIAAVTRLRPAGAGATSW